MNEQKGKSPYVAHGEGEALYANPSAFMGLSRLNRTIRTLYQ